MDEFYGQEFVEEAKRELKPCPFCGGEATTKKYYPYDGYQGEIAVYKVYCKNCKVNIEGHYLEGIIKHWNRRVNNG